MKKVMLIFGTRPEAIKMCPLVLEMRKHPELETVVCVTGQHRQMLDQILECFHVEPKYDLSIMQKNQTLFDVTVNILIRVKEVLENEKPDVVLVHGDTSTAFVTALACFYLQIPVGHVEAGLRTYDKYSPYPEEMNRQLVTRLADLYFCPTENNRANLARESVTEGVFVTGNTVIDALKTTVRKDYRFTTELLNELDYASRKVILVTCHRRENYGQPMEDIMSALAELAGTHPEAELVYPVHLSPVVQECAHRHLDGIGNVHLIAPLSADEMHNLMARCYMVMTDSGGLQEEAPALGKPVLVLRRETERPEAVAAGTVKLAGVERDAILALANELLNDPAAYAAMARAVNPYGDGHACARIADAIEWYFGLRAERPEDHRA